MDKKFLLTLRIICNGEKYKFLQYFNNYEKACAKLEEYENKFYFLVEKYGWDCSEDREDNHPIDRLYWFLLYATSMPREEHENFQVEGSVEDITKEQNWEIHYL